MKIKISEAYEFARANGYAKKKDALATILFPDSSERLAKVNFSNLCKGKTKRIDANQVVAICMEYGVSADFLFGMSGAPAKDAENVRIPIDPNTVREFISAVASVTLFFHKMAKVFHGSK